MKFFVAVAFLAVVGMAAAELTEEQKAKLKAYKEECLKKADGLDVALIEKAKNGEFVHDDKLGIFLECFGKNLKFLNEDGSFNTPVIKEKMAKKVGRDVADIVDKCVEKDEKNGAKNALHLAECLKKNLPAHEGTF